MIPLFPLNDVKQPMTMKFDIVLVYGGITVTISAEEIFHNRW